MSSAKLARICILFVALATTLVLLTRPTSSAHTMPSSPPASASLGSGTTTAEPTATITPVTLPYCWSAVSPPDPGPGNVTLLDIDAAAPDNVWAVGHYQDGPTGSIALH